MGGILGCHIVPPFQGICENGIKASSVDLGWSSVFREEGATTWGGISDGAQIPLRLVPKPGVSGAVEDPLVGSLGPLGESQEIRMHRKSGPGPPPVTNQLGAGG